MKLFGKAPLPPIEDHTPSMNIKAVATSTASALAIMGAVTAASAAISAVRSRHGGR